MSRTKLAPDLMAFLDGLAARTVTVSNATPTQLREQGRALRAVASAADPLAIPIRHAVEKGDQVCGAEVRLMLAAERLRSLSSPPSRRTARAQKRSRS